MARRGFPDRKPTESKSRPRLADPDLKISSTLFDDEIIRHLIDEAIVPALVEKFLGCHNRLPSSGGSSGDKGDQS